MSLICDGCVSVGVGGWMKEIHIEGVKKTLKHKYYMWYGWEVFDEHVR